MNSGLKLSLARGASPRLGGVLVLLAAFPACSSEHLAGPVSSSSERASVLTASDAGTAEGAEGCPLDSPTGRVRHVIYLQVDADRVVREGPDGAPDDEPTPRLLDFVRSRGTLVDSPHASLASGASTQTSRLTAMRTSKLASSDLSTSLTGLYPSSQGRAAASAYGSKNAPAPWVPFARAGCNVGTVSLGTTELAGASNPAWALADEGIAIHCAADSSMCSQSRGGVPDLLPDEPGGYTGFRALFGHEFAAAIIGRSGPPVDLDGEGITDRARHVGFPGAGSITASQSLGYVAAMQERGVAVTFARVPDEPDAPDDAAAGAGHAESVARVAAADRAWGAFVARLASDGITPSNTLFVITVGPGLEGSWLGLVGPGVRHEAATVGMAGDRADTRPTMLLLAGVQDDYSHDGRALVEAMDEEAVPSAVQVDDSLAFGLVASMYERISAPTGELGLTMLEASTSARADDATYARTQSELAALTEKRDALAAEMIQKLEGAEFHARRIDPNAAAALVAHGAELLVEVHSRATAALAR